MHPIPSWPRPDELSIQSDPIDPKEYFQSVLRWAAENGGEEFLFLSLSDWPGKNIDRSKLTSYSIRENIDLPESQSLSFSLPPLLYGPSLVFWLSEEKSLATSFFRIMDRLISVREHASRLFGLALFPEPRWIWKEEEALENSVLVPDKLWERKENGFRLSIPLGLREVFFLGSIASPSSTLSLEWVPEGSSELEAAIFDFVRKRAGSKYGDLVRSLDRNGKGETGDYEPIRFFSLPFHILLQACILTDAWDELVSKWVQERPEKTNALEKLSEWVKNESHPLTKEGFEILFEERTVLLVDKYCGRSDRFLLQLLEREYERWKSIFELESSNRRKEIDEKLIPNLLSRISSHSQFAWPEDLQTEWTEIGESYRKNLENLLVERKKIVPEIPSDGGKTAESWNVLLSYRSE